VKVKICLILLTSISLITSFSCKKEAKCDCSLDSIKVAKVFQPDASLGKEAIIETIAPDQNFGSEPFLTIFSWTNSGTFNTARSLIAFDLTSIPSQTTIKTAKLFLYWNTYQNLTEHTGENAFTLYKISQPWDENSVTWNNQPAITRSDSVIVAKSASVNQSYGIDVTRLVQGMINTPTNNYGFMLKLEQEFPYRLVILTSSDYSDVGKRPKLVVYY